ncbi:MAG: hypothetical protein WDW38_006499 [Sanguina aurantia]
MDAVRGRLTELGLPPSDRREPVLPEQRRAGIDTSPSHHGAASRNGQRRTAAGHSTRSGAIRRLRGDQFSGERCTPAGCGIGLRARRLAAARRAGDAPARRSACRRHADRVAVARRLRGARSDAAAGGCRP